MFMTNNDTKDMPSLCDMSPEAFGTHPDTSSKEDCHTPEAASSAGHPKPEHDEPLRPQKPTPFLRRCLHGFIWLVKDQWFLIVMGILILIASQVQVPSSQQSIKEKVINYLDVAVIFFINGCTTPTKLLLQNFYRWDIHIFVQIQCFLLTSAIAFGVTAATAVNEGFMDADLLLGIVIVGCLPTAIAFNVVLTGKSNGNSALTLTESVLGNLLGPFISTVLIKLYTGVNAWYTQHLPKDSGGYQEIYRRVFKTLGPSVFAPLVVGQLVRAAFPKATDVIFNKYQFKKLSSFSLLILIWQTYDEAFSSHAFAGIKSTEMIFVVFMSAALFLVWVAISLVTSRLWLGIEDTIAVAFVVPTKTPAIGLPLTSVMFAGLSAASLARLRIVTVIYQALQVALGSVITIWFRSWRQKERATKKKREVV